MADLEEQLEEAFIELGISKRNRDSVLSYLNILKNKDMTTYEHLIRVGLISIKIAKHIKLDAKALFFAGILHDVGKILIEPEVLKKNEDYTEEDRKEMNKHPEYTYRMLRGVHEFSAAIAVRHHKFQENGYPEVIPKFRISFSKDTEKKIDYYARILSIADFYDAAINRDNERFGKKLSPEEIKVVLLNKDPDIALIIENLYESKVLGDN